MVQTNVFISMIEMEMDEVITSELEKRKFKVLRATDISGHKDYLDKITQTIRGCGFCVAIFSHATPPITLANIFFELGLAILLGKPAIIIKTEDTKPPSDFVRTEWVDYHIGKKALFRANLGKAIASISGSASYWEKIADTALEAEDTDYELAFERYKQALLISNGKRIRNQIEKISKILKDADRDHPMDPSRKKLANSISEFLHLLPNI